MLTVDIKTMNNGAWSDIVVPEALTERINLIKTFAGTPTIIKIKTDKMESYLCGTPELLEQIRNKAKGAIGKHFMEIDDAHTAIEYGTDMFIKTIQAFCYEKDVEKVFPEKPAQGWVRPVQQELNET